MPAYSDLVHQTTAGNGTGNLALSSVNGKRTFLTAFGTGGTNTFDYYISNRDAAEWERGTGHEASGALVRDTVLASSNANALVNFTAGTKDITNDQPAGKRLDNTRTLTSGGGLTGGGDLSADRTLAVGAGTGITVNADDVALTVPVAVASGGTGSTTAVGALTSLGALPLIGGTLTGPVNFSGPSHWAHSGVGAGSYYSTSGAADRFFAGTDAATDMWRIYSSGAAANIFIIDGATGWITINNGPLQVNNSAGGYFYKAQASGASTVGWGAAVLNDGSFDIDELGVAQRFKIAPGGVVTISNALKAPLSTDSVIGDLTVARDATSGVLHFGTDKGRYIVASGSASFNFVGAPIYCSTINLSSVFTTAASTGTISAASVSGAIQLMSGGASDAAYMSFHRPGVFAANLGIDTDNFWKVGGWSMGAVAYKLFHEGNYPPDVRYDTAQSLTAAQQSQARANINVTKKNYIINGSFMIAQEYVGAQVATNATYPADQWQLVNASAGAPNTQQVASLSPGGSPNRLRVTVGIADASVAAGDIVILRHYIEGLRTADLRSGTASAKTITLQFGVKAPAGTYGIAFHNAGFTRSYVSSFTISAGEANTDVTKSVTLALDTTGTWATDNTTGISIDFTLMAGTNFQTATLNAWQAGNLYTPSSQFNLMGTVNNVFELFDVGLYEGTVAPAYQLPDYADELRACQRYYHKSYANATRPGTNMGAGAATIFEVISANLVWSNTYFFPVRMRTLPTVTIYDWAGNAGYVGGYTTGWGPSTAATGNVRSEISFLTNVGMPSSTTYINFDYVANARF